MSLLLFINMGRKRKYFTSDELRVAKNKQRMKYYEKHKDEEKQKSLKRYYENKWNIQNNK